MKKLLAVILSVMFICTVLGGLNVSADDPIVVFEDFAFEKVVRAEIQNYDFDCEVRASELRKIKNLTIPSLGITSLRGIEYMTSLEDLFCSNNALTSIDVSNLTSLISIRCDMNQLTSLDFSGLTSLFSIRCGDNQLTSLNVNGCVRLNDIDASNNDLTTLDVSDSFEFAYGMYLGIRNINLNGNKNFANLITSPQNQIYSISLSDTAISSFEPAFFPKLLSLNLSYTDVDSIDLSKNPRLCALRIDYTSVTSLDISANTQLELLAIRGLELPNKAELTAMDEMLINYTDGDYTYYSSSMGEENLVIRASGVSDLSALFVLLCQWNEKHSFTYQTETDLNPDAKPVVLKEIVRTEGLINVERITDDDDLYFGVFHADKTDNNIFVELLFEEVEVGDLDFDNSTDVSDIIIMRNRIMNTDQTEEKPRISDLNKDGRTDVSDVVVLRNIIMN